MLGLDLLLISYLNSLAAEEGKDLPISKLIQGIQGMTSYVYRGTGYKNNSCCWIVGRRKKIW